MKLETVCKFRHGGTPSKDNAAFWSGNIPWVSPKDMHVDVVTDTEDHISSEAVANSATSIVPANTLLVTIRSGILARRLPVVLTGREMAFNQDIKAIQPDSEAIEPQFLCYVLKAAESDALKHGVKMGATVHSIKSGFLEKLLIPLPPLGEQRRIAGRLREQMAEVARARAAVQAQLAAARALPAAVLRAHFTTPAALRWPRRQLGEICALLPARSVASDGNTEVRTTTSACLTETGFNPAGIKVARMDADDAKESQLTPGEILIARSNTPELVGRVAMFEGPADGVVASDLTIRLRPVDEGSGQFLTRYLSSLYTDGYWRERASGASGTMKKITRAQLDALEVPFPPLPEQCALAARLTAELSAATALRESLDQRLAAIERLPAALLRTAFNPLS